MAFEFNFNGQTLRLRPAVEADVSTVTQLVRSAYAIWSEAGIEVGSPLRQTDDITRSYLLDNGFVVTLPNGQIIGTVSLEPAQIEIVGADVSVVRRGKRDTYSFSSGKYKREDFASTNYVYLYRLAVDRKYARGGLGRRIMDAVGAHMQAAGSQGIVLDTQRNTEWLYQWYQRQGFETLGDSRPTSPHDPVTVLMLRVFQ